MDLEQFSEILDNIASRFLRVQPSIVVSLVVGDVIPHFVLYNGCVLAFPRP